MYLVNRPAAIASFQKNWRCVSIIAPQCFTMDAEGFISGEAPPLVVETAHEHRIAIMPLVTNRGFSQPLMHTVLDAPESRARAIRYLVYYALRDGYIGFQFDYENIKYLYRDRFTQFFHEAAIEFHKHGLMLSAAVVGKYSDDRSSESPGGYDDWSGVYDYPSLGRDADFLSIMAYPQHAGFSGPGPLAGLPWVRRSWTSRDPICLPERSRSACRSMDFTGSAADAGPRRRNGKGVRPCIRTRRRSSPPTRRNGARMSPLTALCLPIPPAGMSSGTRTPAAWRRSSNLPRPKSSPAFRVGFGQEDPAVWELLARHYSVVARACLFWREASNNVRKRRLAGLGATEAKWGRQFCPAGFRGFLLRCRSRVKGGCWRGMANQPGVTLEVLPSDATPASPRPAPLRPLVR